jgi:mevalonate kinase
MNVFTPGKVILSGEHAIVHGRPALATAVRAGVRGEFHPLPEPVIRITAAPLPPLNLPLAELPALLSEISNRHQAFLDGKIPVTDILTSQTDLLAAAALAEPDTGMEIALTSDLPHGSGLGSSAAVILTILKGLLPDAGKTDLQKRAHRCEQFQHGRSSGLDVAACLHEGLVYGKQGGFDPFPCSVPSFKLYHTGTPESTTGECVSRVTAHFPESDLIWTEFEAVTAKMVTAVLEANEKHFQETVRENHRLLCEIGVVPQSIADAIAEIESAGGAAKICGAGAVRGEAAGTVLVTGPDTLPVPEHWTPLNVL